MGNFDERQWGISVSVINTRQIVIEEMAVAVERHRGGRVPQQSLHDLDVSACTDRQHVSPRRKRAVGMYVAARFHHGRGCGRSTPGPEPGGYSGSFGKLRETDRKVSTPITTPPNQILVFVRLLGFCARPVLFEIKLALSGQD